VIVAGHAVWKVGVILLHHEAITFLTVFRDAVLHPGKMKIIGSSKITRGITIMSKPFIVIYSRGQCFPLALIAL
jgi:hypothetical protein